MQPFSRLPLPLQYKKKLKLSSTLASTKVKMLMDKGLSTAIELDDSIKRAARPPLTDLSNQSAAERKDAKAVSESEAPAAGLVLPSQGGGAACRQQRVITIPHSAKVNEFLGRGPVSAASESAAAPASAEISTEPVSADVHSNGFQSSVSGKREGKVTSTKPLGATVPRKASAPGAKRATNAAAPAAKRAKKAPAPAAKRAKKAAAPVVAAPAVAAPAAAATGAKRRNQKDVSYAGQDEDGALLPCMSAVLRCGHPSP